MKIRYNDLCASCHNEASYHTIGVFSFKNLEYTATLEEMYKNKEKDAACDKFRIDNLKYLEDLYEKKQKGEKV